MTNYDWETLNNITQAITLIITLYDTFTTRYKILYLQHTWKKISTAQSKAVMWLI